MINKDGVLELRYLKSFMAKLIQAPEETKRYYETLKNEVLSYKGVNSRISWNFDTMNSGRYFLLKFAIRGKTLGVYLALDPDKFKRSKYKVEKKSAKKFEEVPCLYRIKNPTRVEYAKELIAMVAKSLNLQKGEEKHESYIPPYEDTETLIKRGLIKKN